MSNPQGIAAVILCGISFVLAVVATAIPFWIYGSVGDTWVSEGLWQSCGHIYDNTECLGLTERSTGIVLPGTVYTFR